MLHGPQGVFREYLEIFSEMLPLVLITATLTFSLGLRYIRRSYLQSTFRQVVGNLVFSSLLSGMIVVCACCLGELVYPEMSPRLELGVAIFVGVFGMKGIDVFLRRRFGLGVVDLSSRLSPDDDAREAPAKSDNGGNGAPAATAGAPNDRERKKDDGPGKPGSGKPQRA